MKNIILIALLVCFVSCNNDMEYDRLPTIKPSDGWAMALKIYTIDSCEYIGKLTGGNSDVLTHKGNCKFCLQNKNKQP